MVAVPSAERRSGSMAAESGLEKGASETDAPGLLPKSWRAHGAVHHSHTPLRSPEQRAVHGRGYIEVVPVLMRLAASSRREVGW